MGKKVLKTRQEVEDFVRGCTFYGVGGGGLPENGIQSLMSEIEKGNEVGWIDPDDIADDAVTICPFLMGSIAPHTEEVKKEMEGFGLTEIKYSEKEQLAMAMKSLADYMGVKIDAMVPIELGGANTPGGIAAGVLNGYPSVDGDYTGRAIPEVLQTTPYIAQKKIWPVACVDAYGNKSFIEDVVNHRMVERIGKLIASGSYGLAGQAGFILSGKEMKELVVKGTMTECLELGKRIREAREAGENPVQASIQHLNGHLMAEGKVIKKETDDRLGYYWGTYTIEGQNEYANNEYKIWFKNENHMMWENEEPIITSPDVITIVDIKTGEPFPNPILAEGQEVAVIGVKSREVFNNKRGLDVLGPRYFGYDVDYISVDERRNGQKG
ncbi:DUF917 domain-containing protein [Facklamia sp. DSM 111018]|uniref:DUF917 domain-containing protein n=1 Tax=Facklamia lactis TaxID=2749967 RepID=A0ABS0LS10_9LACT|nr:DUF917 domain-containing protein [Facklamia lactis]MBG9981072.1 DUF917 domain-containing protein [Facklamia lactis]MBG9986873.1 DUF917 domain-containing protein [Facklamia lactis]